MNTNLGLIGKKLGNTQVFNDDGSVTRVTAVQVGPCVVLGKKTADKDGYTALVLGFGQKREKLVSKPVMGKFKKLGLAPSRVVREFRLPPEALARFEVGQTIKPSDIFSLGQFVDVSGQSKGRGFTGVMKRWNFAGAASDTHGSHEYKRHGGSIGTNMTPGRTLLNLKMPGHYGNERVTIQNLKVARILDAEQIVLIEGAVPGHRNTIVTVRGASKKKAAVA